MFVREILVKTCQFKFNGDIHQGVLLAFSLLIACSVNGRATAQQPLQQPAPPRSRLSSIVKVPPVPPSDSIVLPPRLQIADAGGDSLAVGNTAEKNLAVDSPAVDTTAEQLTAPIGRAIPLESPDAQSLDGDQQQQPSNYHYYSGPGSTSFFAEPVQYDHSVPEEHEPVIYQMTEGVLEAISHPAEPWSKFLAGVLHSEHDLPHSALDSHPIGLQPTPRRPDLLLQWNEEFLAPGFLDQGLVTPTGAIWRPSLWVFGTFRTGFNYFDNGTGRPVSESASRLDLFSQLNLSGTERILFGMRPLDEESGTSRNFTGYDFRDGKSLDGWNADVQTLFFEGDLGEIFPRLDTNDSLSLDIGFSIGRQPMSFQQGLLINEDRIDALTVTRNTLNGNGNLNLRMTGVYAWNSVTPDGQMVGLFTESDFRKSTVNADVAYVWSDEGLDDLIAFGISRIRRFSGFHNTYNSSLHVLASFPTNQESELAGQGELLFHRLSWTPHHTHDLVFLNSFLAIDQFSSASRGSLAGGPLGQTGLLFSPAGLGRYAAPLSNQASNVAGGSLGYQMFFNDKREQVVLEIGGRQNTDSMNDAAIATGLRYQRALDQHWLIVVDAFVAKQESRDVSQGGRVELLLKF